MATVATIKTGLQTLLAAVTGVSRAYAQAPKNLPDSDLPASIPFTGPASNDWVIEGADDDMETREYIIRTYVARVQQGYDGEAEALAEPFVERITDYLAARPSLGGIRGVLRASVIGDGGVSRLAYNQTEYIGVEHRLRVVSMRKVAYAAGE